VTGSTQRGVWVKSNNISAEIESGVFTISIHGEIIKIHYYLQYPQNKTVPSVLNLSLPPFIEYLDRHHFYDIQENTVVFRTIVEGIERDYMGHFNWSFTIKGDAPKPKPAFLFPEPEFLLIRR